MANTINDLYLKYAKNVGKLENDKYFQYLYQMVEAGENALKQEHQIMHKVVDEKWLSTIEDALDSINSIIEKPRRFVARKEEVVPVALAKKITADSVRHLSMNTQFIAHSDNGENIQPTRILNVSNEESFDLYENRFIYHLILRLVTFIDKRTDVIFWSSGDETRNTFEMESKVDDAYEQIEYKVQMTIKNRQNFMEADSDNMNVFMRIDRVRRLVMALRHSSFCEIMSGCAKVRSPIQRTNLLMKDPDYRKCYQLWQFLESYDDVGYSIDVQKKTMEFDEEYLIQMYTNLITNYTVFKTITEDEDRDISKIPPKRRRVLKPKFIRKVEEEIVDGEDFDLLDVEVKQVIVEEVTKAQLEAEKKLAEEIKARKYAEEALEEAEDTIHEYMNRTEAAVEAMAEARENEKEAVKLKQIAEKRYNDLFDEKENAVKTCKQSLDELAAAKANHKAEIEEMQERSARQLEEIYDDTAKQLEELQQDAVVKMVEQKKEADKVLEDTRKYYTDFIANQKKKMEQQLADMLSAHTKELMSQQNASNTVLKAQQAAVDAAIEAERKTANAELTKKLTKQRDEFTKQFEEQTNDLVAQIEKLEAERAKLAEEKHALELSNAQLEIKLNSEEDARARAEQRADHEEKLRLLVEERAGSETISDFFFKSRAERKARKKQDKQD